MGCHIKAEMSLVAVTSSRLMPLFVSPESTKLTFSARMAFSQAVHFHGLVSEAIGRVLEKLA